MTKSRAATASAKMTMCVPTVIQNGWPASAAASGRTRKQTAVSASAMLARGNREQPARPPDEHDRHEDVDRDRAQRGPQILRRGIGEHVLERAGDVRPAERVDRRDQE